MESYNNIMFFYYNVCIYHYTYVLCKYVLMICNKFYENHIYNYDNDHSHDGIHNTHTNDRQPYISYIDMNHKHNYDDILICI